MAGAFEEVAPAKPAVAEPQRPQQARVPAPDMMSTLAKLSKAAAPPPGNPDKSSAPPAQKRTFSPGPSESASGMTVHQILKDPVTLSSLADEIAKWESDNPGRKLKGPAMADLAKNVLPDISDGQATRLAKRIEAERARMAMGEDTYKAGRAAASALRRG